MREREQLFSPPEHQGTVTISGKTVRLFRRQARLGGEEKVFWYADWGDALIATACDSQKECLEAARTYLKRIAEPIIDYTLADHDERKLTNYGFDFRAVVSPGSSEGIYIDCYLEGRFDQSASTRCHAGTIKTLREDVDAYRIMGALTGYLTVYAHKYVNENLDRFEPDNIETEE